MTTFPHHKASKRREVEPNGLMNITEGRETMSLNRAPRVTKNESCPTEALRVDARKKGHEIVFRVMGKNRIAALRKRERDGLTCHWMPRIGPLKGKGGAWETKAGTSPPPLDSVLFVRRATTRSELGPIKSEPIFVERPIKPLENLIDCRSPIRERERVS